MLNFSELKEKSTTWNKSLISKLEKTKNWRMINQNSKFSYTKPNNPKPPLRTKPKNNSDKTLLLETLLRNKFKNTKRATFLKTKPMLTKLMLWILLSLMKKMLWTIHSLTTPTLSLKKKLKTKILEDNSTKPLFN